MFTPAAIALLPSQAHAITLFSWQGSRYHCSLLKFKLHSASKGLEQADETSARAGGG